MEKFTVENIRTKLSKIKEVLLEETPTEEVQLEDAKLVDGTIVRIEPAIEVGATVQVIGEDGELIDAPDADHEMEDGRIIKTEGGIILEVIEVEGEEEVVEEEMSEEEETEPTFEDKLLEKVNELVAKHREDLDAKIAGLKFAKSESVESLTAENKQLKETLVEVVEMFQAFTEQEKEAPKKTPSKAWMSKDSQKIDFSTLLRKN
jgi:hypothetical protein